MFSEKLNNIFKISHNSEPCVYSYLPGATFAK